MIFFLGKSFFLYAKGDKFLLKLDVMNRQTVNF